MSTSLNEPILQVSEVTKVYGKEIDLKLKQIGRRVIGAEEVSFTVNKGEIVGFL